jgi:hypothetical protein
VFMRSDSIAKLAVAFAVVSVGASCATSKIVVGAPPAPATAMQ